MTLRRTDTTIHRDLIERMIEALRLGLYRIAPLGDGIAAVDLHHECERLTCDAVRGPDGHALPDVTMGGGTRRWTDMASIRPDGTGFERRDAVLQRNAELAAAVLSAPAIDDTERSSLIRTLAALAVTCDAPGDGGAMMIAEAPTPWSPLHVSHVPGRMRAAAVQPDPRLVALIPQTASAKRTKQDGERQSVVVDTLRAFVTKENAPDPMSAMRTLAVLSGGRDGGERGDADVDGRQERR